jgi:cobalt-zinc-cadmium efflux system protein
LHDHHHHDHDHAEHALGVALWLNLAFLVIEAGAAWWTGSLALLSDAVHMVSDVGGLVVATLAASIAHRAADHRATFGWARAGIVGAGLNGLTLLAAAAWIVWAAVERLLAGPPPLPGWPMLAVGAAGLAVNLGAAWRLWAADQHDLNIRAALLHMLADALGSVGAMVAAVAVLYGYPAADPAVSVLIAALVGWGAVHVLRASGRVLLQLAPPDFDVPALDRALRQLDGVRDVHALRVWSLDGHAPVVSAHLVSEGEPDAVRRAAEAVAHAAGAHDVTLQVEAAGSGCLHAHREAPC